MQKGYTQEYPQSNLGSEFERQLNFEDIDSS